ncbi:MAG: thermonuclease family protein [Actinomycetota bacterium]
MDLAMFARLVAVAVVLAACAAPRPDAREDPPAPSVLSNRETERQEVAEGPSPAGEPKQDRPVGGGSDGGNGGGGNGGGGRVRHASVIRAIDGDTIEVRSGGRSVDFRLIGIDTPESVAPGQPVECYGKAASAFTARVLEGRRVRLTFDVEHKDHYGRTLAYVWHGGMFNMRLVRAGYATAYPYEPNTRYANRFAEAERIARKHHRGLWGKCRRGSGGGGGNGGGGCDPSYPGVCIPKYPPDLDCSQIPEHDFKVTGKDPHGFDGNHDGRGCET